ncbi:ATP-dependent RNA helicase DbpA [Sessilibacter sp. MAH4]
MSTLQFSTLNLKAALSDNLATLGFKQMTPIQAQSLPLIIDGKDVIAQAKTGSGKTAAFGLGLLNKLNVKKFRVQSLVLCPTRELADQVAKDIRDLARGIHNIKVLTLCGGMPMGPQISSLEHGAHIIVGTPGRIEDHLSKERLNLDDLETLVLDEADRMLEMGFQDSLDKIFSYCPAIRQTLLFSATFPDQINSITAKIMNAPEYVKVESVTAENTINQSFYRVENNEQRIDALRLLLLANQPESAIVFCNTKKTVQDVTSQLKQFGFSAIALHGDLEQRDRNETLVKFANKSALILVATDVAARGLDINDLEAVFNYDLTPDAEVHVHRIGRTGRAGNKGMAYSIYCDKDLGRIVNIEEYQKQAIKILELPNVSVLERTPKTPKMTTLQIDGGKKQKLRPGDIVGGLTGETGIKGDQIGKIQVFDVRAYVAVESKVVKAALKKISNEKMKGKNFRVRAI